MVVSKLVKRRMDAPPGFPPLFPKLSRQDQHMALLYSSHADETERRARIHRVQQSITETVADSSTILTKITHQMDKGKGHVLQYLEDNTLFKRKCLVGDALIVSKPGKDVSPAFDEEVSYTQSMSSKTPFESTGFNLESFNKIPTSIILKARKSVKRRPRHGNKKSEPVLIMSPNKIFNPE
ncbi:unnamed protein product [Arabis nemorensis]|uniref:Uncharacterized protein n=1 Tax=Arabis nemorensis TaxID=586526 RepID=A0A565C412_9BRAS|nr:unnamed protein product [Arabis nemorensis]